MDTEKHFSLDDLSALTGLPKRTIRFYMQLDLVPKPEGANRGAYYLTEHLDRLLEIQKWQKAGLNLQRIGELLRTPQEEILPESHREPGDIAVRSHVYLCPGVELVIDPREARLTPEEMAELTRRVLGALRADKHALNSQTGSATETKSETKSATNTETK